MAQVSMVAYMVAGTFLSLGYWDFYFTFLVVIAATRMLVREEVRKAQAALSGDTGWRRGPLPGMPQPGLALAGRPIVAGQSSVARPQGGGVRGGAVAVRQAPGRLAAPSRPTTRTGLDG